MNLGMKVVKQLRRGGRLQQEASIVEHEAPGPVAGRPALVPHRHVRRACSVGVSFPDPASSRLVPADTDTGLVLPNGSLNEDRDLSKLVFDLLKRDFASLLVPQSLASGRSSPGDKVRIALVDLSAHRLCEPKIAGFGLTQTMLGASTTKVLLYYAAYQLLFDLRELVRIHRIPTLPELRQRLKTEWAGLKCQPDLSWLFSFSNRSAREGGLLAIDMNGARDINARDCATYPRPRSARERPANLLGHLDDIVVDCDSTRKASELIMRLSFEYIASIAFQSGLFHPQRGGLWFSTTYCADGLTASTDTNCHNVVKTFCAAGQSRVIWKNDPVGGGAIQATALSLATFFTLLAQRRLVNPAASAGIEGYLSRGCNFLRRNALLLPVRAAKCGNVGNLRHDAALIEGGSTRYAIAVLTENKGQPARIPFATYQSLIGRLDFIVKNRRLP